MFTPEISASKVAGFIGLHKYQPQEEVFYELLCKDKATKARIAKIEKDHNRRAFHQLANEVLREQPLQDCISQALSACTRTDDVPGVLSEVEEQARIVLQLRCSEFPDELRDRLAEEVRGRVSKQRGLANENLILDNYETTRQVKVTERNTKVLRARCDGFQLIGRTDGYVESENRIVDSKDRTRQWPSVPIYDEIQLRTYMFMTGARESELIERFPDGTTRTTLYLNEESKWNPIYAAIEKNAKKLSEWQEDDEELKRIVFANTVAVA